MRNGNLTRIKESLRNDIGSYPTYEEWKPEKYGIEVEKKTKVLILPMRNGNYT